ncbi:MAG: hypothetical protein JRE43_02670 [Deltaproteobacteria bacterium]|nr:hypothetical protein [Deltaproteobacteria bacterium]
MRVDDRPDSISGKAWEAEGRTGLDRSEGGGLAGEKVAELLNTRSSSRALLPGSGEQQDLFSGRAAKFLLTHNLL